MHNGGVFLRCTRRVKDGKEHRYWSIVENRRGASQRVVQRQVLDLGEINDSQKLCPKELVEIALYIFAARIAEELLIGNERRLSPRGYQSRN